MVIILSKNCSKCRRPRLRDEFCRDRAAKDGLQAQCKLCKRESQGRFREDHPGYYKPRSARWHAENREAHNASMRAYGKIRREELGDQERERVNTAHRANPEARRDREGRRRAAKREVYVENVHPLVLLELHDGVCGICGEDVDPLDFHVDHIDPLGDGGEHSYANTQPAHPACNIAKGMRN